MTKSNRPPSEEPKKKLPNLQPDTDVETSAGRIYLHPLRVGNIIDFKKLKDGDAVSQIRAFLPSIGSLIVKSDEAPECVPLDAAIVAGLSDGEIEKIADAYASAWQTTRENSQERKPAVREMSETASAYLVRLLKAEVDDWSQSSKRLLDPLFRSSSSFLDPVRKSSSALGSTLSAYNELTKSAKPAPLAIPPIQTDHVSRLSDQLAEQARKRKEERAEELELTRLTGQMTAESAKTLKDLAEAATTLMEQMDERDRKTNRSTRTQITIAVASVVFSAVFALLALILSYCAYVQDRDSISSDDQWQMKLLTAIEHGNHQRSAAEHENEILRKQVHVLGARISDLEIAQRAAAAAAAEKAEGATSPHAATDSKAAQP